MHLISWLGRCLLTACLLTVALNPRPAAAIPVFAHRYGLTCQACHTEVPHLTAFGQAFLANGYRIPRIVPKAAFPVAVRVEADYASAGAADPDEVRGGLPKTIVNEIELLSGGSVGERGSYWVEPYIVDGGFPGIVREAWYAQRLTPDHAEIPVLARVGQFTLPVPLDPETFRETTQPYAIWSQTAGANPFSFFDAKMGSEFEIGNPARQLAGTLSIIKGSDPQSGLPTISLDTMETLARSYGPLDLSVYRYDGTRAIAGSGFNNTQDFTGIDDRFWRNGVGIGWSAKHTEVNAVYQVGNDTAADVYHDDLVTSGGFVQVRQTLGARAFAVARWDATSGPSVARSETLGLGYRTTRNTRLTVAETGERSYNGTVLHVLSSSWLFAY